ncbi:metalloprotease PmbA, partial [Buchnera aphidicola]|nr:metalloprotease PmbA [Buchnera aphidicola]
DKAIHISKYSSSDFFTGLPEIKLLYHNKINLDLFHPYVLSIEDIVKLVQLSENSAFKFDKKIINSEGSFFNSYSNITVFGNSLGMLEQYKSTQYSISTCVIAKDKVYMERDFDYSI